ncbi:MAG: efflux transporter outer membrane subunit [Acidisphaera sp.]|nr:efflux transporter outer membrane subunit [Acidisphaera sp.]
MGVGARKHLFGLLLVLGAGGCAVGPDFKGAHSWWSPTSWFGSRPRAALASEPVPETVDPNWWQLFQDPELTSLENRVAAANLDIRVAGLRLAESRAQLTVAQADQFPRLVADGSYTRERVSPRGVLALEGAAPGAAASAAPGTTTTTNSFASQGSVANGLGGRAGAVPNTAAAPFNLWQYGFDASWELDLWGRVRRQVESSRASLAQAREMQRNQLVSVQAELARDYVELRGAQRKLQITQENLDADRQSLKLTQERAAGGLTTQLDVANAQAQVSTAASQLPQLEQQETQTINAISLLLGQPPSALAAELREPRPIPPVPPSVPVGLPSELTRRRPDIREAEAQLHAATAEIGVAIADFFPQVTLSGSVGIQALLAKNLGNWGARQYGLGPSITVPIFEAGRLRGTLELRRQQQQEAAINYQRTVLQALHDVDNALAAYDAEQRRRVQLEQAVAANRQALDLARQRYTQGISTFLDVLDAERSLLAAEQQLTDSTTTVSTNLVALYKALGGGWEDTYPLQGSDI